MKSLTEHLWFEVPGRRGFINITPTIEVKFMGSSQHRLPAPLVPLTKCWV